MADNLLDKASILLTPTAYNDGSMLSVKPNENLYGSELVTNGDFDTSDNWSLTGTGWNISNGKLNGSSASGNTQQDISLEVGKKYKIRFTISNWTSGDVYVRPSYSSGVSYYVNGDGDYYEEFTATSANTPLVIRARPSIPFTGSIDNVSVVEDLSGDFTFSRGSAATRVNAQGLVENVQIISSELVSNGNFSQEGSELITNGDFATDSDWNKVNATISGGKGNLDGDGQTSILWQDILTNGSSYKATFTVSDYNGLGDAKVINNNGISIFNITSNGTFTIYFQHNIASGNILFRALSGAVFSIDNVSVKEVGQDWDLGTGWSIGDDVAVREGLNSYSNIKQDGILTIGKTYKVTYTINQGAVNGVRVNIGGVYYGDYYGVGTHTIYGEAANADLFLMAEPLFQGSISNISVKEITDDTDIPRIDYTDGCGSWLLEGQSTNLITYSSDFSDSSWAKTQTIIEAANIAMPNGVINGYKLFANTSNVSHWIEVSPFPTATSGQNFTLSLFIKSAGSDFIQVASSTGFNSRYQNFNISTGTKASGDISDSSITDFGNGWYRISVTEITTGTNARYLIAPILSDVGRNPLFAGNANEDGVYIWGAQLENLSYATSYIPTNGSIATRLADVANNSGNSTLINSTEGVLYAEMAALADDLTNRYITISDSSNSNYIRLTYTTTSNQLGARYYVNGSFQCALTYILTDETEFIKVAFKWKENDFALWVDGVEVATDASGNVNPENTFHRLDFGRQDGFLPFYGKAKALAVYKEALTDAELQSLTTQ